MAVRAVLMWESLDILLPTVVACSQEVAKDPFMKEDKMDTQIGAALPTSDVMNYEKYPGFMDTLNQIRENEETSFKVEFPDDFDMSKNFRIKYPDGNTVEHSMVFSVSLGPQQFICYHPIQVLESIAAKQVAFARKQQMEKVKEAQEELESKRNIEDIKAKLASLDEEGED